jgi:hypothetical protein
VSTTPQDTALVTIEKLTAVQLFQPGAIDPMLDRIKAESRARAASLDISKSDDRKELASLAYQLARSRTFIDSQRKALVSDEKKRLAVIDKEGSRIWDELEALQKEVRAPLTEWEQAEKDRVAALEVRIEYLTLAGNCQGLPTASIAAKIEELEAYDVSDMEEFTRRAALAKSESLQKLRPMLAAAQQADADRAELERHRKEAAERAQKEHEANIARLAREEAEAVAERKRIAAEEKAERDAVAERVRLESEAKRREEVERAAKEKAIKDKIEAEQRAIRAEGERLEAVAKAERDRLAAIEKAEQDRIAAEKRAEQEKAAAVQRERERVAAAAEAERILNEKREANRRIRARVHNQMITAIMAAGFDDDTAKKIVDMIAAGEVPHVTVTY